MSEDKKKKEELGNILTGFIYLWLWVIIALVIAFVTESYMESDFDTTYAVIVGTIALALACKNTFSKPPSSP
jgi:hypothetical protein